MLLAADNLNVVNPVVAEALRRLDPLPIQDIARRCERAGAHYIDVNPGPLSARNEDRMPFMVEAIRKVSNLPLILDSPSPRVLRKGLSACPEPPLLNGLSGEPDKVAEIPALAAESAAGLVILLMDERSYSPPTLEEKLALALELTQHALDAGLRLDQLIIDPILPHLSWENAHQRIQADVQTVRMLTCGAVFQEPVATMTGLSNLRSSMRTRYPADTEHTTLHLLAGAGLTHALANALAPDLMTHWRQTEELS